MEKLYVNEIRSNGEASTIGLFYSRSEAETIVAQLLRVEEKSDCRYEIVEATRHVLSVKDSQRSQTAEKQ